MRGGQGRGVGQGGGNEQVLQLVGTVRNFLVTSSALFSSVVTGTCTL